MSFSTKSPSMCRLLSHNLHIPDNNDCVHKLMTDCTETDAEKRWQLSQNLYFIRTNCTEISNLAVSTQPYLLYHIITKVPRDNTPFFFLSPYYSEQEKKNQWSCSIVMLRSNRIKIMDLLKFLKLIKVKLYVTYQAAVLFSLNIVHSPFTLKSLCIHILVWTSSKISTKINPDFLCDQPVYPLYLNLNKPCSI
jgi:hypothetical protein